MLTRKHIWNYANRVLAEESDRPEVI